MRPISNPQSAFRTPLNYVLGTEAAVRILRAVMLSDIPVGVGELARLTGLQRSGVDRTCVRLEDLGVIEAVGRGARYRQYRRASRFGLANQLSALFNEERSRAEHMLRDLRQIVADPQAAVRAAWIEGPVATGTDRPEDPLDVAVLTNAPSVDKVRTILWDRLLAVQQQRDVRIELRVWTLADMKTAPLTQRRLWSRVLLLHGPSPADLIRPPASSSAKRSRRHAIRDEQSLALAAALAARIRDDPSIIQEARRYIERRLSSASPGEQLELREWSAILATMSVPRLRRLLVEDSERARRLRQSLPFLDVLTADQRREVLASAGLER